MREFDLEELAKFDGKEGRPAYIVVHGWVIDVSESKLWKDGIHMQRHHAGKNLTTDIKAAPHSPETLAKFPQVGILKKEIPLVEVPPALSRLLKRIPMLRRHPHPMTVHFPVVLMFCTTTFNILYLITGIKAFELTALHCLGAALLFTPMAILTGYYTWWLNYQSRPLRPVTIKKRISITMFFLQIIVFAWRIKVPDVLDSFGIASAIYFLLVLLFLPMVIAMGWFGARLTFPIHKE
jgi:predicted heme/steroid binding protein/uncharacterized membrane protein